MYCSFISSEAKLEGKKLEKHGECVAYVALFMVFAAHVWLTWLSMLHPSVVDLIDHVASKWRRQRRLSL